MTQEAHLDWWQLILLLPSYQHCDGLLHLLIMHDETVVKSTTLFCCTILQYLVIDHVVAHFTCSRPTAILSHPMMPSVLLWMDTLIIIKLFQGLALIGQSQATWLDGFNIFLVNIHIYPPLMVVLYDQQKECFCWWMNLSKLCPSWSHCNSRDAQSFSVINPSNDFVAGCKILLQILKYNSTLSCISMKSCNSGNELMPSFKENQAFIKHKKECVNLIPSKSPEQNTSLHILQFLFLNPD